MPGRILVVGSYLLGIAMQVEAFPAAGETVVAGGIGRGHGGKGSNQAIQAARCGAPVRLLSAVGLDEAGNHAARQWAADGNDSDLVERSAEEATGLGFILVNPRGENQIVIDPGATARCDALFVSRRREAFADVAIVLTQLEIPVTGAIAALEEGRRQGAVTILNPAPARASLPDALFQAADIVIPNEGEAQRLAGGGGIVANGRALSARARRAAVITAGPAGAYLFPSGGAAIRVAAPELAIRDTTGAGDAFAGAFAARLAETGDLVDATRQGTAAGSLACTLHGVVPALHRRAEIAALARTLTEERLGS